MSSVTRIIIRIVMCCGLAECHVVLQLEHLHSVLLYALLSIRTPTSTDLNEGPLAPLHAQARPRCA